MEYPCSALLIVNPERNPLVVAEIKLGKVALQMGGTAVLVHPVHATFEDAEKAFDRVGVRAIQADTMLMTDESSVYRSIGREFKYHFTVQHGIGEYVRGRQNSRVGPGGIGLPIRQLVAEPGDPAGAAALGANRAV
jgi:hypothetical protein